MKIFEIRWKEGEKSWVSSNTVVETIQTYCNNSDFVLSDFDGDEEIVELPKEKWGEYYITDENGLPDITFEKWMEDNEGDCDIIAETMY